MLYFIVRFPKSFVLDFLLNMSILSGAWRSIPPCLSLSHSKQTWQIHGCTV